jgi:hypothetical protein
MGMDGGIQGIVPAEENVRRWLLETLRHTCQVMYYSELFKIGLNDPELPHDIAGRYNKLEWDVMGGCALGYSNLDHHDKEVFQLTREAVCLHRNQYHHRKWDWPDEEATADDLRFGALDTVCALMENRPYYAHISSFEELQRDLGCIIKDGYNKVLKLQWITSVVDMIKQVERPAVARIERLDDFPNVGLSTRVYGQIAGRMQDALKMLREEKGYVF